MEGEQVENKELTEASQGCNAPVQTNENLQANAGAQAKEPAEVRAKGGAEAGIPRALVMEGGGMRGLFTAGVIDVLMERGITFDAGVGVSAGACFGCNYKSHQPGRVLRYNTRFAHEWRMNSWRSWLLTGDLIGAKFAYHTLPRELDVFDTDEFTRNPMRFWVVTTSVDTGKPVYKELHRGDDYDCDWIRASASMPLVSRIVHIDGQGLLDGGIGDSIPLRFMQSQGYERCLVITTQPRGFVKKQTRAIGLMRWWLRRHPAIAQAMTDRPDMYNRQLEYLAAEEAAGRAVVIAPPEPLGISNVSHDTDQMKRVYALGRHAAEQYLASLEANR